MFRKKKVDFVSDIDQFLVKFNESHPKSPSQQAEIQKYEKLNRLRDEKAQSEENA